MNTISSVSYSSNPYSQIQQKPVARSVTVESGSPETMMMSTAVMQRELADKGVSNQTVNTLNELSSQAINTQMMIQTAQTYVASANSANSSNDASSSSSVSATVVVTPDELNTEYDASAPRPTPYYQDMDARVAAAYSPMMSLQPASHVSAFA